MSTKPTGDPIASPATGRSNLERLPSIVLNAQSVPSGFALSLEASYTPGEIAAQGTYELSDLRGWHYLGGYEREFEREDASNPAKISSDAGAYGTAAGIKSSFARNRVNCQSGGWQIILEDVRLGDESILCSRDTSVRGYEARVFFVVWRKGRIKSAVTVTALLGKNTPALALSLARKQAAHY
jgi:hypothetical protein